MDCQDSPDLAAQVFGLCDRFSPMVPIPVSSPLSSKQLWQVFFGDGLATALDLSAHRAEADKWQLLGLTH